MSLVVSPDPVVLTGEAFSLTVHCVQSTKTDIVMTLNSPSFGADVGAIKIRSVNFSESISQNGI